MNLETRLAFSTCLLVLVVSVVPVRSTNSVDTNAAAVDRVRRRSFYNTWTVPAQRNSLSLYEASNTYRAAPYTVPRPYYIPVYGTPGRPLIFYPPQAIYANPGMPQDNPVQQSFGGLTYLPQKESPHFVRDTSLPPKEGPTTTTPKSQAPVRFDTDDEEVGQDDPNAPIWMNTNGGMVAMQLSGDQQKEDSIPTRAPMSRATRPPLVHDAQASGQSQVRPARPPSPPQAVQRPSTIRTTAVGTTTVSPPSGPSNCVWAIISCCSAANPSVLPQNCFEQRGCPGPFWGSSPCESDYARAAIASAVNYYNNPRSGFRI